MVNGTNMTTVAVVVSEEERTVTGIPVRLLWVPYVGLGLVLVGLMLASFLRYHCKHGHKYQQRRLELWKKLNMAHLMDGLPSPPPNGGLLPHPAPKKERKRKPLKFESNANGSMVDVRCTNQTFLPETEIGPPEQAAPIKARLPDGAALPPLLPPGPSPSQHKTKHASPVIWTLSRPRGGSGGGSRTPLTFFSSPMDIQPDEIEAEDDNALLLQNTPL